MLDHPPDLPRIAGTQSPARSSHPNAVASQFGPYAAGMVPPDTHALLGQLLKILFKQRWKLIHFVTIAMLLANTLRAAELELP